MSHPSDNVARVLCGLIFWSALLVGTPCVVIPFLIDLIEWTLDIGGRRTGHVANDVQ